MNQRLAAAQAALNSGRAADAIENLVAAIETDPAQPVQVYRALMIQLYQTARYEEGDHWGSAAVARFPRDYDLWNTLGVVRRRLKRYPEALKALDQAIKLQPAGQAAYTNRGNILLDIGDFVRAEQLFAKLARQDPRNWDHQRQLGRSLLGQGKRDAAFVRLRQAVAIKKDAVDPWLDMIGSLNELGRYTEAEELVDKALVHLPNEVRMLEAKITVVRRSGQLRRAEAILLEWLPRFEDQAWIHYQIGTVISDWDRVRGNVHMRRAVELDPKSLDYLTALIESLERTRTGDEGLNIDESYDLVEKAFAIGGFGPSHKKILNEVLVRVAAFEQIPQLGDFKTLGREWAETNKHTALLKQLPRVRTMDDRLELLEQHCIWGRKTEAAAAENPVNRHKGPRPPGKIRLGLMSSDLRRHPVAYFAQPLFEHLDRERFEVFCYSYYQGKEDPLQARIASQVTAFRWKPDISAQDAAQMIADDQLDLLIELGGTTHMNKLEVMAFRPAARQASWLGYPHSAGLSTIDYLMVDPFLMPDPPELLLEQPMMMPRSWIALGQLAFPESHVIDPQPPMARNGFVTFGTANNPYKYGPEMLEAWARILAAVPGSKFLFVRPEGTSRHFRRNVLTHFEQHGVAAERVIFEAVRGAHMPHYNRIDIALDTFPQTGGTTTCEAAWMGTPTVSLVGPALFERLSYSILMNAGLQDMCVQSIEDYVARATALAGDGARIAELRVNLRAQLKASPLGQTEQFARDFYDLVVRTVAIEPA